MTREQAIRAQKGTPSPYPAFTPQQTNGKFSENTPLLPQATLILCTIYATVAIFCLVCALVVGIMQM